MSDVIVKVEGLSKKYLLSHQQTARYSTFRESIESSICSAAQAVTNIVRKDPALAPTQEEFWALKDVSFDVRVGDRLGIIGRNGAGKSTLLKVLSRIVEPTKGRISIHGRVASLLEVGTGFHPELTGRENIYLNGAILGMSRSEIKRKFDEIVAFAEIEKFLDTPVKRYSSGMYVRLAFAVAAHLEPEILIVDEVLAVGDAQFQKKCLAKMQSVSGEGRTILFVSHNMEAIRKICSRGLVITSGASSGVHENIESAILEYRAQVSNSSEIAVWRNTSKAAFSHLVQPLSMYIGDEHGQALTSSIRNDNDAWVYIDFDLRTLDSALQIGYGLFNQDDSLIYWSCHTDAKMKDWPGLVIGRNRLRSQLPRRLLNEGSYRLDLLLALYNRQWLSEPGRNVPSIQLEIAGGISDSPYWSVKRPGHLAPVLQWENVPDNMRSY